MSGTKGKHVRIQLDYICMLCTKHALKESFDNCIIIFYLYLLFVVVGGGFCQRTSDG